ncbi:hypothetical protein BEN30_16100 [Magnetovibrio blakemorei]|uniref:Rap1a immunity protein domain-containing protein n=2 Tax=Magnetovibrio blakemorei TaxID=28181 RepID=A0A1E5Q4E2_9PROT|nr:hypothetical protein BEN30_16100 [Magnetovibrio blakemorei]
MMQLCKDEISYCLAFISGFREGVMLSVGVANNLKSEGDKFGEIVIGCPPVDVENGLLFMVWKKYMESHPEDLRKFPGITLSYALSEVFPCKTP